MFYEPVKQDHGLSKNPFNSLIIPRPIGWISSIDNEGVVHLWTHPHNFIKGESQYKLFDDILTMVKEAVDCDKMRIMTQQEFCTLNLKKLHS